MKRYFRSIMADPVRREATRRYKLARKHGITLGQLTRLERVKKCTLCNRPLGDYRAIDHDHRTGIVRGVLHRECNVALGKLKDSPSLLRRAAAYIEQGGMNINATSVR